MAFSCLRLIALMVTGAMLSGCLGTGADLANSVDTSLSTGAIPKTVASNDMADAVTVKDAVSQADPAAVSGAPIPWANSASGSAGVIERAEAAIRRLMATPP